MPDLFKLEIKLGNSAMETPLDVARALREISWQLDAEYSWDDAEATRQALKDENGNTTGKWEIV